MELDGRFAWFRNIYCAGEIYLSWWDMYTHIYQPVTGEEENRFELYELRTIVKTIAELSKLELFSTEIAYTENNTFVVVDYVNDQIDLQLQSKTVNGVPDEIVENIVKSLVKLIVEKI